MFAGLDASLVDCFKLLNCFQSAVDFPKNYLACRNVLLENHLVITINVNQLEAFDEIVLNHNTQLEDQQ